ncbi:RCKP-type rubredoxin-like domain-containing protein [Thermovenabulum sp.]|uniref:RCKP-type rubredoxin-like domain-containing protein n=1 Tax=Thermovenabulum sp. TaxID=3100335 RepID=UPI003C798442
MALFKCSMCGFEKETRCKPKECPECKAKDSFTKVEVKATEDAAEGKKTTKRCCKIKE